MRTVPARAMSGARALGRVRGGWRRWTGARAATRDAGFGAKARSRPPGDQPFPGLLPSETLSREQLVDVLRAAVVDRKGPLVTLNKPQGLPVTGKPGELTLHSVLPELSRSLGLGESEFQVVQAPGKEISGLVLLSSCAQTASRLHEFFTHSRRAHRPTATYWAVTDGIPATPEGEIQAALKLERADGVDLVSEHVGSEEGSFEMSCTDKQAGKRRGPPRCITEEASPQVYHTGKRGPQVYHTHREEGGPRWITQGRGGPQVDHTHREEGGPRCITLTGKRGTPGGSHREEGGPQVYHTHREEGGPRCITQGGGGPPGGSHSQGRGGPKVYHTHREEGDPRWITQGRGGPPGVSHSQGRGGPQVYHTHREEGGPQVYHTHREEGGPQVYHTGKRGGPQVYHTHREEGGPQVYHTGKRVLPVKPPSRRDVLASVKRTLSHFRVVATGSGCALVQLQPLTGFPRQLQVHMTLQLCPVLGDHVHSARVGTVLGQRFLLPAESTKPQTQAAQLPLHLHLRRLLLPGTRPGDAPTQLLAPPPPYFSRTLQCLGLCQQQSLLCS
nr:mitochondrial mRNA pseudouridine synthase RPUSD3 [Oryctolagus cuniculus]